MYLEVPDSWRAWQNKRLTELALLSCLMVNTLKAEGKLWKSYSESTFETQGWLMIYTMGRGNKQVRLETGQEYNQWIKTRRGVLYLPTIQISGNRWDSTALLVQGMKHLVPQLCCICTVYLAYRYIPTDWKQGKVMFISKPGKSDYTEAKVYCSIRLLSFLLKVMEKLMDSHIIDQCMEGVRSASKPNMLTRLENLPKLHFTIW